MAVQSGGGIDVPMLASGTISQYEPVKLDNSVTTGGSVNRVAAVTDIPYGIAQQDAVAGQMVDVRIAGVSKMRVSATGVAAGALATIDATDKTEIVGFAESGAGTTLTWVYGQVGASGVNNEIVPVKLIMCRTTA